MTQRNITASLRREMERQESGETVLVFLTLSHPALADDIRVVADPVDFIWGGKTFIGFLFDIELLSDTEAPPEARLTIQNVDRKIGNVLREITDPIRVQIDVIAASEFDLSVKPRVPLGTLAVEYSAPALWLVDVEVDVLQISGRIASWNYTQEIWPGVRATQDRLPGLFR